MQETILMDKPATTPEYTPGLFGPGPAGSPEDANRTKAACLLGAARTLLESMSAGTRVDRRLLRRAMEDAFGGATDAGGAWSWKEAYDAAEAAVVLFIRRFGGPMSRAGDKPAPAAQVLARYRKLEELEPPESIRSETQVRLQQFSTPIPLAWLAVHAARIRPADQVLEPSAGTGILAELAQCKLDTARGGRLTLNELGQGRAALLAALFNDTPVSRHDAEAIGDYLPEAEPDVVVMNPPFSRSPGMSGLQANADTRHVRAAYSTLRPGGRLVAVTSEACRPWNAEWEKLFSTAPAPPSIALTTALDGYRFYRRHGTTFDCRLTVIDRPTARENPPSRLAASDRNRVCRSADELLDTIESLLPERLRPDARQRKKRTTTGSRHVKRNRSGKPAAGAAHNWGPVERLNYRVVDDAEKAVGESATSSYETWRPETIRMPHATDHPTSLVQSRAMAAVAHPKPDYRPLLPLAVTEQAKLSDAQLESIVLAGQATDKHLKTRHLISSDWESTVEVNEGGDAVDADSYNEALESGKQFRLQPVRFRQGWMLGDGTGTGKGRQVAGVILDNWLRGRRRSLWLSQSDKLVADARRDWVAIGGRASDIIPLGKVRQGEPVPAAQGILFCTYATLRSVSRQGRGSRLDQIVEWLADGTNEAARDAFEGAIVFDESHAMSHAAGGKGNRGPIAPSAQGLAGLRLQNALPDARVLYVSATGATTITGLAYATRLGLWAAGITPFATRKSFVEAMTAGGVAALEVVARDLKALGFYQARALAYDGVEIDLIEHTLTDVQRGIYNEYADAFSIIHENIKAACEVTGIIDGGKALNASARAAAHSAFESTKQRFFNHLLTGMKVPTLIRHMERDVENRMAPVVQLVSTGEALMERRILRIPPSEWSDLSIDLTPREYVIEYLMHAFPTQLQKRSRDEEGKEISVPVFDDDGRPVACQEACQARDMLVEHLASLPPVQSALDQLLHHFGDEKIAEMTGRSRRVLRTDDGAGDRLALKPRSATASLAETDAFMTGNKRMAVFSMAGGIGVSYHADLGCGNRWRRRHYLLEAGWRDDQAIQGLGRTHRTHQASAPFFCPVSTDVKGERRFISTIAKRLDSLGAITRGQRDSQTSMGGENRRLFKDSDNFESLYAKAALQTFYQLVARGHIDGYNAERLREKTGLRIVDDENCLLENLPPMHQFLNRLLALRIEEQNHLFSILEDLIENNIEAAVEAGTFNQGVEEIKADSILLKSREVLYTDEHTGAESELAELVLRRRNKPLTAGDAIARAEAATQPNDVWRLVVNSRSKRAGVVVKAPTRWDDNGNPEPRVRILRPTDRLAMTAAAIEHSSWKPAGDSRWKSAWDKEIEELPEYDETRFWLVTGLLLPIWNRLPAEDMRVRRVTTDDGERLVGRMLRMGEVNKALEKFGRKDQIQVTGQEVWDQLTSHNASFRLADDLRLSRRRLMGTERVEIDGAYGDAVTTLKKLGCRTEIVSYRTRVFAPTLHVLEKVLRRYPLAGGGA